jgi:hypothetical protein
MDAAPTELIAKCALCTYEDLGSYGAGFSLVDEPESQVVGCNP